MTGDLTANEQWIQEYTKYVNLFPCRGLKPQLFCLFLSYWSLWLYLPLIKQHLPFTVPNFFSFFNAFEFHFLLLASEKSNHSSSHIWRHRLNFFSKTITNFSQTPTLFFIINFNNFFLQISLKSTPSPIIIKKKFNENIFYPSKQ